MVNFPITKSLQSPDKPRNENSVPVADRGKTRDDDRPRSRAISFTVTPDLHASPKHLQNKSRKKRKLVLKIVSNGTTRIGRSSSEKQISENGESSESNRNILISIANLTSNVKIEEAFVKVGFGTGSNYDFAHAAFCSAVSTEDDLMAYYVPRDDPHTVAKADSSYQGNSGQDVGERRD
ncbi:hypothetical protein L218DRAFT_942318 [Marasmius fiardii PR-910]|nr:hypothetical protein L218DRAFT_942318 [Marasmius fiardii PR-910]